MSKKVRIVVATTDMNEHEFIGPLEAKSRFLVSYYSDKLINVSEYGKEKYIVPGNVVSFTFEELEEEDDK